MRMFLAVIFVFGVMIATIVLSVFLLSMGLPGWIVAPIVTSEFFFSIWLAHHLFNPRSHLDSEGFVRDLETKGLLETITYQALRAFEVKEFEDEGLHYFVELQDKSVIYLTGQYLYEYEPIGDDPESKHWRRFPCTEFAIRRHRNEGYVIDLICGGTPLEPEVVAPPFDSRGFGSADVPQDGQIISDRTYNQIKDERMKVGW